MSDVDIAQLRSRIEQEIEKLKATIADLEEVTKPVEPDVAIGRLSRLDTMMNQSVSGAALSTARIRLNKLVHMLERLEEPDFGYCEECGEPIPMARLLSVPESSLCVECAE